MPIFPDLESGVSTRARFFEIIAERPTPFFLMDAAILTDRAAAMRTRLAARWGPSAVAYSFKTNYQVAGLPLLQQQGVLAEVVSGREYALARKLGYAGPQIVFNGPYKSDEDLRRALRDGALLHVHGGAELERLVRVATALGGRFPIGIRVAASLPYFGHSRFGFSLDDGEADAAVARIRGCPALELAALHFHGLGDTTDPGCYRLAAGRLATFARESLPEAGRELRSVDLGGGYPAHGPRPHRREPESWDPRPIGEYVDAIVEGLAPAFPADGRPKLILEPGRYLVNDAILLVARVIDVPDRRREARRVVLSDASISMLPLIHYTPQIVRAFSPDLEPRSGRLHDTVLYGASCREDDILQQGELPEVRAGDFLAFYAVGAYNANMGPDFIFETPPLVVL